jgi:glycosyltransferase involved in cell wall biosynthesis
VTLPEVSVVIPTYNDVNILPETLAPLLADGATGEVVVVVDGSRDGTIELLRAMAERDPRLRPFWIENRGMQGARQYGLERARYDIVLMLDADVVPTHDMVSGHAAWHSDDVDRLVVGYMPPRIGPKRAGSFVIERYAALYEEACADFAANPGQILVHMWAGNVSAAKRSVEAAGGHLGGVTVPYMEDVDLALRLADVDITPVFDPCLIAEHRFEKTVAGAFKTAQDYGEALIMMEHRYPGRIVHPGWHSDGLGNELRRFTRRRRGLALVRAVGRPVLAAVGRLRLWSLEWRVARALDGVEIQQGMLRAIRVLGSGG